MNAHWIVFAAAISAAIVIGPSRAHADTPAPAPASASAPLHVTSTPDGIGRVSLTDAEWKKRLTPGQFQVMRKEGTEIAFTGKYWDQHAAGIYRCASCGLELFNSENKFDSGTGWPSFWQPIAKGHVKERHDSTFGMRRTEVECPRCGGHLGHVFDDGPAPTHLRYCINSASLEFAAKK